jgi:hypothetical protein
MARKQSGMGLGGLLVVLALLYFTGAGNWLWERVKQFDGQCGEALASLGTTMGSGFCNGFGHAVEAIDRGAANLGDQFSGLSNLRERISALFGASDFEGMTGRLHDMLISGDSPLTRWASSGDRLSEIMNRGPESVSLGADASQRIRAALDNFIIGRHYLQSGEGFTANALPWLREGAQQPGYGILSQLTLGDIYRNGTQGIPQNPQISLNYYQQAQQSLYTLSQSNTPEAKQLLNSLPASPQQIQQQLNTIIIDIRKQMQRR